MPVFKCNGKWKIGKNGECRFNSKEAAENAFRHWVKNMEGEFLPDGNNIELSGAVFHIDVLMEFYGKPLETIEATYEVYDEERIE